MKTDLNKVIFADSIEELEQKMAEEQSKAKGKDCHEKLCGVDRLRLNRGFKADTFTPTFNQVIAAGFKREEPQSKDGAFEEAHGYPYFLVNYEADNFIIEWDVLTHELTISVCDVLIGKISFEKAKEIIEASEPYAEN
jgi:hypothetical protein